MFDRHIFWTFYFNVLPLLAGQQKWQHVACNAPKITDVHFWETPSNPDTDISTRSHTAETVSAIFLLFVSSEASTAQ